MLHPHLHKKIIAALKDCVLFSAMNDEQFDRILTISNLLQKNTDQMIFRQGTPLEHIYFVYQGAVKLGRGSIKGDEKIIEVILPGRTFAEGVLFAGAPKYPVTATALKSSSVVSIQASPLLSLLKSSADLCINMMGHLSARLHWMLKELDKQALHNASFRIVDYFLSQIESVVVENEYKLTLPVSKRHIASRLSIKPETFSRTLKVLEKKQLIDVNKHNIVLKNVKELRQLIELEEL